ncbi:uncharacterized protein [Rutidosis leptorrhynchoides]|uniref:uncharacterized protein n=1 Tax=Rutidosis leptorrhynchoides TaxID=125765 RepID=UPI003A994C33
MESKTKQKSASSGCQSIIDNGIEVVNNNNTNSLDHWQFLEEIEAPMWADLSLCEITNDDTDDAWFDTSHQFHQWSSRQLISLFSHPKNVLQEPSSPKLPGSVSKSRGKNYKVKVWEQRKKKPISSKQPTVKTVPKKSIVSQGSSNKVNLFSRTTKLKENERPKASSSCESNTTRPTRTKLSKSSCSPSLTSKEQEHESSCRSTITSEHSENQEKKSLGQTSTQTSGLLSSLRISLRKSCVTRPAARVVRNNGRSSEGCKSSSSNSSVGSQLDQGSFGKKVILGDAQNNIKTEQLKNKVKVNNVTKAPVLNVKSLSNRQGNNVIVSKATNKGKVQQQTSLGRVLMPCKVNEQCQPTYKY